LDPEEKKHAEERIDLIPDLLIHEMMLVSVGLLVMVLAVATFFHAPLEAPADPQITPLHTEAPWYFLWLQGLLKLGDKTFFGIIVPTLIFGVLFVLPWLDRNPHRLASRRKFAIGMGIISIVAMVILTYMGLPAYGIETPAAQDILSHYAPQTHPGPVRELDYEELETGPDGARRTYFVSYPESYATDPQYADEELYTFIERPMPGEEPRSEFHEILLELKADVESEPRLMAPLDDSQAFAVVTVENIQPDLKWVEFRIAWDEFVRDPDTGEVVLIEDPETGQMRPMIKRDEKDDPVPDEQYAVVTRHRDANYD
jgi:hypothetical protein